MFEDEGGIRRGEQTAMAVLCDQVSSSDFLVCIIPPRQSRWNTYKKKDDYGIISHTNPVTTGRINPTPTLIIRILSSKNVGTRFKGFRSPFPIADGQEKTQKYLTMMVTAACISGYMEAARAARAGDASELRKGMELC